MPKQPLPPIIFCTDHTLFGKDGRLVRVDAMAGEGRGQQNLLNMALHFAPTR